MNKWVVVLGNPFDGMKLFGPFDYMTDAQEYGESFAGNDWWLVEVSPPAKEEA
jgi:hypothetical protein